jgi:hypothetical protein
MAGALPYNYGINMTHAIEVVNFATGNPMIMSCVRLLLAKTFACGLTVLRRGAGVGGTLKPVPLEDALPIQDQYIDLGKDIMEMLIFLGFAVVRLSDATQQPYVMQLEHYKLAWREQQGVEREYAVMDTLGQPLADCAVLISDKPRNLNNGTMRSRVIEIIEKLVQQDTVLLSHNYTLWNRAFVMAQVGYRDLTMVPPTSEREGWADDSLGKDSAVFRRKIMTSAQVDVKTALASVAAAPMPASGTSLTKPTVLPSPQERIASMPPGIELTNAPVPEPATVLEQELMPLDDIVLMSLGVPRQLLASSSARISADLMSIKKQFNDSTVLDWQKTCSRMLSSIYNVLDPRKFEAVAQDRFRRKAAAAGDNGDVSRAPTLRTIRERVRANVQAVITVVHDPMLLPEEIVLLKNEELIGREKAAQLAVAAHGLDPSYALTDAELKTQKKQRDDDEVEHTGKMAKVEADAKEGAKAKFGTKPKPPGS